MVEQAWLRDVTVLPPPRVLAFCEYYAPGRNAGGPIRSLLGLVEKLGDEFDFNIVTRDRDLGADVPYPNVPTDEWRQLGPARVRYLAPGHESFQRQRELLRATPHDLLYLNSVFSGHFGVKPLLLRRLRLVPSKPVIVAPRGELHPGALGLKRVKKRLFLAVARLVGLYAKVTWHASGAQEAADIRRQFGSDSRVRVAVNLVSAPAPDLRPRSDVKVPGRLRVAFVSRIVRKKNLRGALDILREVTADVKLDIYGPTEDAAYWAECRRAIAALPANVEVSYCGDLSQTEVLSVLAAHDLMLLPTLGENFGHIIFEALLAGCPPLISDRTPWRGLEEKGVGWDLPLDRPALFSATIDRCAAMDEAEHSRLTAAARTFAREIIENPEAAQSNRLLFMEAMDARPDRAASHA